MRMFFFEKLWYTEKFRGTPKIWIYIIRIYYYTKYGIIWDNYPKKVLFGTIDYILWTDVILVGYVRWENWPYRIHGDRAQFIMKQWGKWWYMGWKGMGTPTPTGEKKKRNMRLSSAGYVKYPGKTNKRPSRVGASHPESAPSVSKATKKRADCSWMSLSCQG